MDGDHDDPWNFNHHSTEPLQGRRQRTLKASDTMRLSSAFFLSLAGLVVVATESFVVTSKQSSFVSRTNASHQSHLRLADQDRQQDRDTQDWLEKASSVVAATFLGITIASSAVFSVAPVAFADQTYDGFAEYAKENQMQQSDVGCFIKECGEQTKNLFSNPRGIKGITCLGRCKGEQSCATRCFAEFGSENLNDWLSCAIEEKECVKVPKDIDNSAENVGYSTAVRNFDPKSLIGTWYKTDGELSFFRNEFHAGYPIVSSSSQA